LRPLPDQLTAQSDRAEADNRERAEGRGRQRRAVLAQRAAVTGVDAAGRDLRRLRRHAAVAVAVTVAVALLRAGAVLHRAEALADDRDGGRVGQVAAVGAGGGP